MNRKLDTIAGLTTEQLAKFNTQNKKLVKDLTSEEIESLGNEARLSIKYLDGEKYSKSEMELVIRKFVKPFVNQYCITWEVAGSYRRKDFPCGDLDLLVVLNTYPVFDDNIVIRNGDKRTKLLYKFSERWIPIDIFYTEYEYWAYSLLHFTGSKVFNIQLRKAAKDNGYKLNEYGLYDSNGTRLPGLRTERQIMEVIFDKYYKPEERSK